MTNVDVRTDAVPRRVVLLGASNLTKGISTVLATAYHAWGRPLEVLTALGHGRSYGRPVRVLGRRLPGILQCGIWDALSRSRAMPTASLVTDIGNDLLYEEPVDVIVEWLRECFDRLARYSTRTTVTLLPTGNLAELSRDHFLLIRTLFVPHSRITLEEVSVRAFALNEHLTRLARERGFSLVEQRVEWYGFDPIHITHRQRAAAWREILSSWSEDPAPLPLARGTLARTLYLRSLAPEQRNLFGIEQRRSQPSGRLSDGTTVSIY